MRAQVEAMKTDAVRLLIMIVVNLPVLVLSDGGFLKVVKNVLVEVRGIREYPDDGYISLAKNSIVKVVNFERDYHHGMRAYIELSKGYITMDEKVQKITEEDAFDAIVAMSGQTSDCSFMRRLQGGNCTEQKNEGKGVKKLVLVVVGILLMGGIFAIGFIVGRRFQSKDKTEIVMGETEIAMGPTIEYPADKVALGHAADVILYA